MRNNSGGVISAANEILDYLLPKSTMGSLVFRNGSKEQFYSEPDQIRLKKIIIMVDENSASSSEYLALSLKKHLDNVVVIGHPTFGKGVGQATFEDKKKGYLILLTNFIWDVKG